jgi:hypothetical protein
MTNINSIRSYLYLQVGVVTYEVCNLELLSWGTHDDWLGDGKCSQLDNVYSWLEITPRKAEYHGPKNGYEMKELGRVASD